MHVCSDTHTHTHTFLGNSRFTIDKTEKLAHRVVSEHYNSVALISALHVLVIFVHGRLEIVLEMY